MNRLLKPLIILILPSMLITSCFIKNLSFEKTIESPTKQQKIDFDSAEKELNAGKEDLAIKKFESFIAKNPATTLTDNAIFKVGEIYYNRKDYKNAVKYYEKIVNDYQLSDFLNETRYKLGISYNKLGNHSRAISALQSLIGQALSKKRKAQVSYIIADSYYKTSKYLSSLKWYVQVMELSSEEEVVQLSRSLIIDIIENKLGDNEIREVIKLYPKKFPSVYAESMLAKIPTEIKEEPKGKIYKIGCILPLSGKYSNFGERVLHGIQLAIGSFNTSKISDDLSIIVYIKDSEGSSELAEQAVKELVEKEDVITIIGPLTSACTESAAKEAEEHKIPIITLTQKEGITKIGEYVFRNGLTTSTQVNAIVKYAVDVLNVKNFIVFYPEDPYGIEFKKHFEEAVKYKRAEVKRVQSYGAKETDFADEIKNLLDIEFDAIFIPDYSNNIALIAPQLKFYDIRDVQLLGTSGWNSSYLLEESGKYVEGAIFVDGFFKDSEEKILREFVDNYINTFWEDPDILSAIGYDTINIIKSVLKDGSIQTRSEFRNALLNVKEYPGITGFTSFTEDGDVNKNAYLLKIERGKIIQIN